MTTSASPSGSGTGQASTAGLETANPGLAAADAGGSPAGRTCPGATLYPQVTFFGSPGSNLPAWVMNASTGLPVSASTTLPKTSTACGTTAGRSFFASTGWD